MKHWYQSKTIWALVVSAIAHLLVIIGIGEDEANRAAAELVAVLAPFVGLVADAFGAWARRNALGPLA